MKPMLKLADTELSLLDLVPIRAGGTVAIALENSLAVARHVEALGFKRFWLAEHHNMDGVASSATAVLVGYIAGGTSRIRVGSGGVMLPNHAPLVVAEQFGTLATLYPGRIDLGLGRAPGTDQATMRALRRDRLGDGEDFPQQVAELRGLLAPAQPGQRIVATPGAGTEVPIWLLGSSLFSAQLAGQLGLPYAFASHFAPRLLSQALAVYRQGFRPSAVLQKPYVMVGVPLIAAENDQQANYLASTTQQRILALLRGQSLLQQPPVRNLEAQWAPDERAAVQNFLAMAVIGGPERVREGLQKIVDATQADELMLVSDTYEHADRLRSLQIAANSRG